MIDLIDKWYSLEEIAEYLGFAICFQIVVYLVTYFIVNKKN